MRLLRNFLAFLGALLSGVVAGDHARFAAPYTGQPVASYEVELHIARERSTSIRIPDDCARALGLMQDGAAYWASTVERRLWAKVIDDCNYNDMLHPTTAPALRDHVSHYDFLNGALFDLPLGMGCAIPGTPCDRLPPDAPKLGDLVRSGPDVEIRDGQQECRITEGVFRGHIHTGPKGLICEADADEPGFRIIAVNFADLNGDGFQDVVLRLVPIGPGRGRVPMVLALTRKSSDEAFSILPPGEIGGR